MESICYGTTDRRATASLPSRHPLDCFAPDMQALFPLDPLSRKRYELAYRIKLSAAPPASASLRPWLAALQVDSSPMYRVQQRQGAMRIMTTADATHEDVFAVCKLAGRADNTGTFVRIMLRDRLQFADLAWSNGWLDDRERRIAQVIVTSLLPLALQGTLNFRAISHNLVAFCQGQTWLADLQHFAATAPSNEVFAMLRDMADAVPMGVMADVFATAYPRLDGKQRLEVLSSAQFLSSTFPNRGLSGLHPALRAMRKLEAANPDDKSCAERLEVLDTLLANNDPTDAANPPVQVKTSIYKTRDELFVGPTVAECKAILSRPRSFGESLRRRRAIMSLMSVDAPAERHVKAICKRGDGTPHFGFVHTILADCARSALVARGNSNEASPQAKAAIQEIFTSGRNAHWFTVDCRSPFMAPHFYDAVARFAPCWAGSATMATVFGRADATQRRAMLGALLQTKFLSLHLREPFLAHINADEDSSLRDAVGNALRTLSVAKPDAQ